MKLKFLSSALVLSFFGCTSNADDSKQGYKVLELLQNAQETIIKSSPNSQRVVFRNEQIRTHVNYSVVCGEYGFKQSFWDRNIMFNRYIIFKKDHVILEKAIDKKEFSAMWNQNCIG